MGKQTSQKGGLPAGKAKVCVVTAEMNGKQTSHIRELCMRALQAPLKSPRVPREPVFVGLLHRGPLMLVNVSYQIETSNVLQLCLGEYGALSFLHSSLDLPNLLVSGA